MQQLTPQHLSAIAAQVFLASLPESIQLALNAYAAQLDYPLEAAIEMAIAGFLDEDATSFADCQPLTTGGKLKLLDEV